ncbi:hydantoinase/oxoprolinase N-terminal domain-containing protein [Streptomyces sp. KL116D]|uniref:hydantoinase/oxoprolinase N-terminal domain-containing protein n=1 Tax=Streptomyces sp. KL116D TaxID=3045152 RepID=UPI0035577450
MDVGPTSTDAVLLDDTRPVAAVKVPSRPGDAIGSLVAAVEELPAEVRARAVTLAVGLRVAARAVTERSGLAQVGVLRIGAPPPTPCGRCSAGPRSCARRCAPGWRTWRAAVVWRRWTGPRWTRRRSPRSGAGLAGRAEAFAVSSVFSPADGAQERAAARIPAGAGRAGRARCCCPARSARSA